MKNLLNKKRSKILKDNRGCLFFFENSNFKRVFFIYGKKNQIKYAVVLSQLIVNINVSENFYIKQKGKKM